MKKNILGSVIKELRKEQKMTQKELSKLTGYSQNTISNHENGNRSLTESDIKKYSEALMTTPDNLFKKVDLTQNNKNELVPLYDTNKIINDTSSIMSKLNSNRQTNVYEFATSQLKEQNNIVQLNQELFDIEVAQKVAAGHKNNGIVHLDNKTNYNVQVPANEVPPKYDIAFEVAGQSMEPFFQDGQIVFVEQQEAYDGMLGVVIIDGQAFLKRIKIEDNLLRLISMNKEDDSFKDIIVTPECDIQIVGRVVM